MATKVNTVEPVFIKDSDMPLSDLTPYTVVKAVIQKVSAQYVEGVQKIGSLWRIYLNSVHSRLDFISKKTVVIHGKAVPLYEQNPFKTHQKTPQERKDKLTVRGLPLSVSNQEIQTLLESKGEVLASSIKYSQIRNEDGTLTEFLNGDRFLYCEPLSTPLPRQQTICNFQCLVYHHGMNNNQCKSCNTLGHKSGDNHCPAKAEQGTILAFCGHQDPLSNHFPAPILAFDEDEPFKSIEHAFFWRMACDLDKPAF